MALYAASSSSCKKYDVFISFRGEDTRRNFTSHLHDAFSRKKIQTYIDYRLPKGDEISSALMQAIEDSHIAVVVFSENYASSRWCLDELAHILHCKKDWGQLVIPVFYEVDPTHVRHQTGPYEEAFKKYEKGLRQQHKVPSWRAALNEAANLAGWDSHGFRDDSKLIQNIVGEVLQKLDHRYPSTELKGLIGLDINFAHIESLLGEAQTIGIWGMGGIGKTTIAKAIFSKYASHYEGFCFLENVRQFSIRDGNGLHDLKCKLFSKLIGEENNEVSNFVKVRVTRLKVFIVLDDLNALKQLEYLALDGEQHRFGAGSRIIITTRDKHVLSKGVDKIYEMKKLESEESLHLLSLNAFGQRLPINGYERLLERAASYANGVPLALNVLGSHLRGKSEKEWDSALSKLERIPHEDIQNVLRLSFDGLNHEEKEIFLDIACFLKGKVIDDVIRLVDAYGFYATIGIRALQDKALITIDDNYVRMHDLMQEMGHEIVRQESIKEPGKRSRLWDSQEVYDVLAYHKGSNKVEGINLDVSQIKDLHLTMNAFKKMPHLRFLRLYSTFNKGSSHLHLPKGLKFLPNKIGYLEWYGYPLRSLPSTFCPQKLVELCLHNSQVQKLWVGEQDLVNLKVINLSKSKMLMELPDLSKALNLEMVDLGGCKSLHYVHSSILSLHSLIKLVLRGCKKLKSLRSEIHLRSLTYLNVDGCLELKEFSISSEKITSLDLYHTGIEILHPSIGRSSNLEHLTLPSFRLKNLPDELSCLKVLTKLTLSNCEVLNNSKLQILLNGLRSLSKLYLDDCVNITEVPNNIQNVLELQVLSLRCCKRLRSLPKLPQSITNFRANGCESLETVTAFRPPTKIREMSFLNCMKLNDQSVHSMIEDAYSVMIEAVKRLSSCHMYFPGSRVPTWFTYRTTQSSIIVDHLPTSKILGYAFCVVQCASVHPLSAKLEVARCGENSKVWDFRIDRLPGENNSDHVYLWFDRFYSFRIRSEILRRANDEPVSNLRLSFRISVFDEWGSCFIDNVIKEIGIWPIYASEYKEWVRQREMKKHDKRPRDADEEELLRQFKKPKL